MGRYVELFEKLVAEMEKKGYEQSPSEVRTKSPDGDLIHTDNGLCSYPILGANLSNNNSLPAGEGLYSFNSYSQRPSEGVKSYIENKKHNNININSKIALQPDGLKSPEVRIKRIKSTTTPLGGPFQAFVESDRNKALNQRYVQAVVDARRFLDDFDEQAETLGWRADELFGLDDAAPLARYDRMGLVWMLGGDHVVAITASSAVIRVRESGSELRFYRRPRVSVASA
jgi:hypothetical protein